ncbi:MAG: bifunctional pyr operon transcriptional regulator/uracil phosphoribosyltransferase PyrR [Oscillospiraceae bacterium]|nr:bifunctional pyr operon transcriptional regulator/uracil phosphoribosyltransferase PyrR [Oscillospiraceae bacterium]
MSRSGLTQKAVIMDENSMKRAVARISYEILERNKGADKLCFIGILSRGVYIARRIAEKLEELEGAAPQVGVLDITAYRDDEKCSDSGDRTDIPFDVKDKRVVIVDDVIFTGRSARAAIDAVMKRGRPRNIQLAALVDRGHRELPIRPDYVGKNLPTSRDEAVKVMMKEIDGCDKVVIFE